MQNHIVLITGASSGIGAACAKIFAHAGAKLILAARRWDRLQQLADSLDIPSDKIYLLELDVCDRLAVESAINNLSPSWSNIDILINNAGLYPNSSFDAIDYEAWLDAFKINTLAAFKMTKAFLPHLKKGELKKIASLTSKMGSIDDNAGGGEYLYRSSKTALNMVMKSLSIDLKPYDMSLITLHPGWVRTDMGGPNGLIDAEESVTGMKRQIDKLSMKTSGQFIAYDGKKIPW